MTAEQAKAIMNRYESEINTYDDFIIVDHVLTAKSLSLYFSY